MSGRNMDDLTVWQRRTELLEVADPLPLGGHNGRTTMQHRIRLVDRSHQLAEFNHFGRRWRFLQRSWRQPTGNEEGSRPFTGQLPSQLASEEFALELRECIQIGTRATDSKPLFLPRCLDDL